MGKNKKQRRQRQRLPLRAATPSLTRKHPLATTTTRGNHFSGDKESQEKIQAILIEIIRKWRATEQKQPNGEPIRGSRDKLVKEYLKLNLSWLTSNKVKMKWKNMSDADKKRIDDGLPPLPSTKEISPPLPTPLNSVPMAFG